MEAVSGDSSPGHGTQVLLRGVSPRGDRARDSQDRVEGVLRGGDSFHMRHVEIVEAAVADGKRALCVGCGKWMRWDKFTILSRTKRPFCYCKRCNSKRARRWNTLNVDACRRNARRYARLHKEMLAENSRQRARDSGYWSKREQRWEKQGIRFDGKPLTAAVFFKMLELQGGCCAISGINQTWVSLVPDHDHKTNEIRGILSMDINHHALSCYERTHHYRSPLHEAALKAYLDNPPAKRFRAQLIEEQNRHVAERPI